MPLLPVSECNAVKKRHESGDPQSGLCYANDIGHKHKIYLLESSSNFYGYNSSGWLKIMGRGAKGPLLGGQWS